MVDRACSDLDFARADPRVFAAGRPSRHVAVDLDHVLVVQLRGNRVRLGRRRRIDHHLHQPGSIAQVDEDQPAVVAHGMHPALQHHRLADVGGAHLAAHLAALHWPSRINFARSLPVWSAPTLLTADCRWLRAWRSTSTFPSVCRSARTATSIARQRASIASTRTCNRSSASSSSTPPRRARSTACSSAAGRRA